MKDIYAIVLAAGKSSRMRGAHKLLLPFRGQAMIRGVIAPMLETTVKEVIVVTGFNEGEVAHALQGLPVTTVFNEMAEQGMMGSIQAGLRACPPEAAAYLICLADMPLLTTADYQWVLDHMLSDAPEAIYRPWRDNQPGHPTLVPRYYRDEILAQAPQQAGLRPLFQPYHTKIKHLDPPNEHYFVDIDTPAAYQALLRQHS